MKGGILWTIDFSAGQIRGQQIRCELYAMKFCLQSLGQRLDGGGLGQTRRTFHEQVSVCEQGNDQAQGKRLLVDNALIDIVSELRDLSLSRYGRVA